MTRSLWNTILPFGVLLWLIIPCVCAIEWSSHITQPLNTTDAISSESWATQEQNKIISPVTISWLSGGRPSFLLADMLDSALTLIVPTTSGPDSKGFLGVPSYLHQPTQHPYSDRSTAKEADSAGRTSSEWNLWLTLLIAMVAAAILS